MLKDNCTNGRLLKCIISSGIIVSIAPVDELFVHKNFRFRLTEMKLESLSELRCGILAARLEAGHLRSLAHEFNEQYQIVSRFSQGLLILLATTHSWNGQW